MTTLREAAQRALEALEFLSLDFMMLDLISPGREAGYKAIAALKAALAEQDDDLTAAWMAGAAAERKRAEQSLRDLCAAAYQVVGVADGPVEMLDNLWAAAEGKPLPHDPGAGLPWSPPAPQPLTIERLRDALVASRIIDPGAVEDADHYDDGLTLHRIEALFRRIA